MRRVASPRGRSVRCDVAAGHCRRRLRLWSLVFLLVLLMPAIYSWTGMAMEPSNLRAGAFRAMELDINPDGRR